MVLTEEKMLEWDLESEKNLIMEKEAIMDEEITEND